MKLTDTHSHLYDTAFDADREEALARAAAAGVEHLLLPGIDSESHGALFDLCRRHPGQCVPMMGLHPTSVNDNPHWREELALVERYLTAPPEGIARFCAVGEIGLDYYWEENPPREFQQQVFRRQLALAQELQLPVIVHDREAHADTLSIVREFPDVTGVFHCFSGSPEMAQELLKLGWYLGFDGPVTYKNARRAPEVAAVTPLDRMLIETDSPYMTPVPYRGKRNDSGYVRLVAEKLAEWKGVAPEEMARLTTENGKRLFRIS